jgi:hypothetical protein
MLFVPLTSQVLHYCNSECIQPCWPILAFLHPRSNSTASKTSIQSVTYQQSASNKYYSTGHEISGLNPVARSESLAVIFSRTDLIQKKRPNAYRQTKIFGRQWQPGDRKFRTLL